MAGHNTLTFGFLLPQRSIFFGVTTLPDLMAMARTVEATELFESLWVGDSLFSKPRPESLTLLAALAMITTRVKLGTACMATFPLRDPLFFAYQWANLDMLSNGRMLLGACTGIVTAAGASQREGAPYGIRDKDRAARLEENIRICRLLWGEDSVTFTGQYHSFEDMTLLPKPVQQPCPIWIAANPYDPRFVKRSMDRVATMADGWMTAQVFPGMLASNLKILRESLLAAGKDPDTFPNTLVHNININENRQAALDETQRFLDEYYGPFDPAMTKAWTVYGSPQACIDGLKQLAADGAKGFILRATSWNQETQFVRLVNEVLPYVQD